MNSQNVSYNGIGFIGILTILFIALKLTGYIKWSWFWILSPLWLSAFGFIFILFAILFLAIYFDK